MLHEVHIAKGSQEAGFGQNLVTPVRSEFFVSKLFHVINYVIGSIYHSVYMSPAVFVVRVGFIVRESVQLIIFERTGTDSRHEVETDVIVSNKV